MTAASVVAPCIILVACAAYLLWSRRRAVRRGERASWNRMMRRMTLALAIFIGGAFGLAMLTLAFGASIPEAERIGAIWQIAFLVALVGWRVVRRG